MDSAQLRQERILSLIRALSKPESLEGEGVIDYLSAYFSDQDIDLIYDSLLRRGDTQSFYWLAQYLVKIERTHGFEKIFSLLASKDPQIRQIAKRAVAKIAPEARTKLLIRMLQLPRSEDICYATAQLALIRSPSAVPYLLDTLTQHEDVPVRIGLLKALAKFKDMRALSVLEKFAKETAGPVQQEALIALSQFASSGNHYFYQVCFQSSASGVREVAYRKAAQSHNKDLERLAAGRLLQGEAQELQLVFLSALRTIETQELFRIVFDLAFKDRSAFVRTMAESALRRAKSRQLFRWLLARVKTDVPAEREFIVGLLAEYPNRPKVFRLFRNWYRKSQDKRFRLWLLDATGRLHHWAAKSFLLKIAKDQNPFSYPAAIALSSSLRRPDWDVIWRVFAIQHEQASLIHQFFLRYMLRLPKESAMPESVEEQIEIFLDSPHPPVVFLAAQATARFTRRDPFQKLLKLILENPNSLVRRGATIGLVAYVQENFDSLLPLLDLTSRNHRVFCVAARVFRTIWLERESLERVMRYLVDLYLNVGIKLSTGHKRQEIRFLLLLRSVVENHIELFIEVLRDENWDELSLGLLIRVLNLIDVERLQCFNLDFTVNLFKRSLREESKLQFLEMFRRLKLPSEPIQKAVFSGLAVEKAEIISGLEEQLVMQWLNPSAKTKGSS